MRDPLEPVFDPVYDCRKLIRVLPNLRPVCGSRYIDYDTGWTIQGSNAGGVEIFGARPDRLRGPPNLLHNVYRFFFFPRIKRRGSGVDHPPPSSPEVKESVDL